PVPKEWCRQLQVPGLIPSVRCSSVSTRPTTVTAGDFIQRELAPAGEACGGRGRATSVTSVFGSTWGVSPPQVPRSRDHESIPRGVPFEQPPRTRRTWKVLSSFRSEERRVGKECRARR